MKTFLLAFLSLTFFSSHGQITLIENVKLFDGEKVIEQVNVKIEGDRIIEISPIIEYDEHTTIINGQGKTLIPALSNAHVHAWNPNSLKEAAKAGILNVMDMHGMENYQQFMLNVKDSTNYARFYRTGYAATAPDGHGTQFGFDVPTLKGPQDAKTFVKNRLEAPVDYIKIIVEPYKNTLSHETVKALIHEAHKVNLKAVVHVSRLEDAVKVLSNNADGLVHIWWDKPIEDFRLQQLKEEHKFFIIPTLLTTLKAFEAMASSNSAFMSKKELMLEIKKIHDIGIPILAGTDPPNFNINYSTDLYEELFLLHEAGLSEIEVLQSATSNITKSFDLEKTGYIRPDYIADMILVEGDPTSDIRDVKKIEKVWKAGQEVTIGKN